MGEPTAVRRGRVLLVDVGSTTTKVLLFRRDAAGWRFDRAEAATTVAAPHADVGIGLTRALGALSEKTGLTLLDDGRPTEPLLLTSSAGGGLAMVVTGLVKKITSQSAERAALGAGAVLLATIAIDDGRVPYRKVELLERLRPDMVLFAGGFDGEAISGPVFLAELLRQAKVEPKLSGESRLAVVYAGNARAADLVRETLGDGYLFHPVPNLRPGPDGENLEPARTAIHELFMEHVMSHAPGYSGLRDWVGAPILPTPSAVARILEAVSATRKGKILAVDIGGATTDVFTAEDGEVFRTVSANLGMSYSLLNVAAVGGIAAIREALREEIDETRILNCLGEKHIRPTMLPRTLEEQRVEWAAAASAIREAVREHLSVLSGQPLSRGEGELSIDAIVRRQKRILTRESRLKLPGYRLVLGSGGILSHSPRDAAAHILETALRPKRATRLAVDRAFLLPHLGVLSTVDPELAVQLYDEIAEVELDGKRRAFVPVATAVPPARANAEASPPPPEVGTIRLRRELALAGEVAVVVGQTVLGDDVVARCVREFRRPFFLPVADALHVSRDAVAALLTKGVGDPIGKDEVLAVRPGSVFTKEVYRSPVAGRVERVLPDGSVVVREAAESADEFVAVEVARDLDVAPYKLAPHLRIAVGQEVEKGQALAALPISSAFRKSVAPVRGRIDRIDETFGIVLIAPIRTELEVRAFLPGIVEEVTDRGAVVAAPGTIVPGMWGLGGEASGPLALREPAAGCVLAVEAPEPGLLANLADSGIAALVTGSLDLEEVLRVAPEFPLVLLDGFGACPVRPEAWSALAAHAGRLALVDARTEIRVGVRRPRVLLP